MRGYSNFFWNFFRLKFPIFWWSRNFLNIICLCWNGRTWWSAARLRIIAWKEFVSETHFFGNGAVAQRFAVLTQPSWVRISKFLSDFFVRRATKVLLTMRHWVNSIKNNFFQCWKCQVSLKYYSFVDDDVRLCASIVVIRDSVASFICIKHLINVMIRELNKFIQMRNWRLIKRCI